MNASKLMLIVFAMFVTTVGQVQASIVWDWTFDSEAGQFVTDGSAPVAGTYTMTDFIVSSSSVGGVTGSLSGGDYATTLSTDQPLSFVWDGSHVTLWLHSGTNTFDWWAFEETTDPTRAYVFAWDTGNINDPTRAAYYDSDLGSLFPISVGDLTVSPASAVPEPASIVMLGLGGMGMGLAACRRRRLAVT